MLLEVLIISAMPISEIRGAIPLALYHGLSPLTAYITALIGNIIPVPILLISLNKILRIINKNERLNSVYKKFHERIEKRRYLIERYGYLGLTIFVAIPLPITGAWTASVIATILNLKKIKSFIFITIGICIAGFLVLITSLGVLNLLKLLQLPL